MHLLFRISKMHIPCFLTGGRYNEIEGSLSGRQAEAFLRSINPDIAFLSCEGLSADGTVTDGNADIAEIDKIAVERAKTAVLCCGEKVAWVEGFGADRAFCADQNTKTMLIVQKEELS